MLATAEEQVDFQNSDLSHGTAVSKDDSDKHRFSWDLLTDEEAMKKRAQLNMSGLATMHEYYNYLVTGDRRTHYLKYFKEKYLKEKICICSLGCGNGLLERNLVKVFDYPYYRIDAYDINPKCIKYALNEAEKENIKDLFYFEKDLNRVNLPENEYDLVIFFHSLHHIDNVEYVFTEVRKTLKSKGLLLIVDYFGPTRWQWTDKQLAIVNEVLGILPQELRIDISKSTKAKTFIKNKVVKPQLEDIISFDPSEAIRSSELYSLVKKNFHLVEEKPLGGTLLNLLFENIAGNFDEENININTLICLLQKFEEILIKEEVVQSDFLFLVSCNYR
jgi:SAM-dependent methyltransferase